MIKFPRIVCMMLLIMLSACSTSFALFRINVFRPYDINLRTHRWDCEPIQITGWAEIGTHTKAYNRDGEKVNPLQLFQFTHNAVAMLGGITPINQEQKILLQRVGMLAPYEPTSPITAFTEPLRGNMRFTGDFDYKGGFGINARYVFPYNISLAVFVPFYSMKLKNVRIVDLTSQENFDPQDVRVRQLITNNFVDVVHLFDPALNLDGWKKTGIGDVAVMVEWWRDFPQGKPWLKNVSLNIRGGVSFPTGIKTDVNDLFSVPFGCDGSTALVFGAGIDLDWFNCLPFINQLRGGLDVQFWQIFGNTRERRIKTAPTQTDLFYLVKDRAFIDPGFAQQYNLYLETHHLVRGLSLSATYQFVKQSRSHVTLFNNNNSELIANSSKALKAWKVFQLLFAAEYDTLYDVSPDALIKPQFKLIYKLPVAGKRVIACDTITAVMSFNF
ncbi:MAG: hypothetical protein AB7F19_03005 [Candidatus Babeliales bacterium]